VVGVSIFSYIHLYLGFGVRVRVWVGSRVRISDGVRVRVGGRHI
jgi:hypothetical protein